MLLLISFVAVVVAGLNFLIEKSSLTRMMKSVTRVVLLVIALSVTFYWVRNMGTGN
jgi:hypothetical protein